MWLEAQFDRMDDAAGLRYPPTKLGWPQRKHLHFPTVSPRGWKCCELCGCWTGRNAYETFSKVPSTWPPCKDAAKIIFQWIDRGLFCGSWSIKGQRSLRHLLLLNPLPSLQRTDFAPVPNTRKQDEPWFAHLHIYMCGCSIFKTKCGIRTMMLFF